jgi:hypothetical protein
MRAAMGLFSCAGFCADANRFCSRRVRGLRLGIDRTALNGLVIFRGAVAEMAEGGGLLNPAKPRRPRPERTAQALDLILKNCHSGTPRDRGRTCRILCEAHTGRGRYRHPDIGRKRLIGLRFRANSHTRKRRSRRLPAARNPAALRSCRPGRSGGVGLCRILCGRGAAQAGLVAVVRPALSAMSAGAVAAQNVAVGVDLKP